MRDDLLEATAAIDWAVSNFPAFKTRLKAWMDSNVNTVIRESDSDPVYNELVAIEKESLPLGFGVEAGAYINTLRSALDILAVALGKRHHITKLNDLYFPVARDEAAFRSGDFKGSKLVKGISSTERAIIEMLKPYKGGNDLLFALHHLDITRKHHRLLAVNHATAKFGIIGWWPQSAIKLVPGKTGWIGEARNGETVLLLIRKDAEPHTKLQYTPDIFISEPDIGFREPVIAALDQFAGMTKSIISFFDNP